jgi:hypothetical protein
MIVLRRVGFFSELRHGAADGPSLADAKGKLRVDHDPIVSYLRRGSVLAATPERTYDVLSPTPREIGSLDMHTDGTWVWPSDLAYYVDVYRVALPEAFLRHGQAHRWQAPELSESELLEAEERFFRATRGNDAS